MKFIALLFSYTIIFGCNTKNKDENLTQIQKQKIELQSLNNEAIKLADDPTKYEQAFLLLDSALKISPDYSFAKSNKFAFLAKKGDYKNLLTLNQQFNVAGIQCGEYYMNTAILFELLGNKDSSKIYYGKSITQLNSCLFNAPNIDGDVNLLIQAAGYYSYASQKKFSDEALSKLRKIKGFEDYNVKTKAEFIQSASFTRDGNNYSKPEFK